MANTSPLAVFFSDEAEVVAGQYLYPWRMFGSLPDGYEPIESTNVVREIPVLDQVVLVTGNGGLFVRPPADLVSRAPTSFNNLSAEQAKRVVAFQDELVEVLNLLICELAFEGVVSEPASPIHVSFRGRLVGKRALIMGASSGGREVYFDRLMLPVRKISGQDIGEGGCVSLLSVLDNAAKSQRAKTLHEIAPTLPALVAGAYSLFSRRHRAEALLDGWIVIEQILYRCWKRHVAEAARDSGHRNRLTDTRAYSASVQAEVLRTANKLPAELYDQMNRARKHRNDLAHGAKVSLEAASDCMVAMKSAIEFACGESVESPLCYTGASV